MRKLEFSHYTRPGEAFHISRSHIVNAKPFPLHEHNYVEVFWLERGDGLHLVNGRTLTLKRGQIVFMRPKDAHAFRTDSPKGMMVVNVAFPTETMESIRNRYVTPHSDPWPSGEALPRTVQATPVELEWLRLQAEGMSQGPRPALKIDHFLLSLLVRLERHAPRGGEGVLPDWLGRALEAIKAPENLGGGTQRLARLAGKSPEHVARILRSAMGITPTQAVNRARMEFASWKLTMSDMEIQDVAMACGFESLGHFYQCFRSHFGQSPRRYRLSQRAVMGLGPATGRPGIKGPE